MENADEKKPPQGRQVEVLIVQDGTLMVAFTDDGYVAGLGLQSRGDGVQQPKPESSAPFASRRSFFEGLRTLAHQLLPAALRRSL